MIIIERSITTFSQLDTRKNTLQRSQRITACTCKTPNTHLKISVTEVGSAHFQGNLSVSYQDSQPPSESVSESILCIFLPEAIASITYSFTAEEVADMDMSALRRQIANYSYFMDTGVNRQWAFSSWSSFRRILPRWFHQCLTIGFSLHPCSPHGGIEIRFFARADNGDDVRVACLRFEQTIGEAQKKVDWLAEKVKNFRLMYLEYESKHQKVAVIFPKEGEKTLFIMTADDDGNPKENPTKLETEETVNKASPSENPAKESQKEAPKTSWIRFPIYYGQRWAYYRFILVPRIPRTFPSFPLFSNICTRKLFCCHFLLFKLIPHFNSRNFSGNIFFQSDPPPLTFPY